MGYLDTDSESSLMARYGFQFDSSPGALKPKEYNYKVNSDNHTEDRKEEIGRAHV